jgi:CHAT domain-containing protein
MKPTTRIHSKIVTLLVACLSLARLQAQAPHVADCERQLDADPGSKDAAYCLFLTASAPGEEQPGAEALVRAAERFPANPWLWYYRSKLAGVEETEEARLLGVAAQRFAAQGDVDGEVRARAEHFRLLDRLGRMDEGAGEAVTTTLLAAGAASELTQAIGKLAEARFLITRDVDLERALILSTAAQRSLFPGGPASQRQQCLTDLADAQFAVGRLRESQATYQSLVELAREQGAPFNEALARYGVLRSFRERQAEAPEPGSREVALDLARQALDVAVAAHNRGVEMRALSVLGQLVGGEEAREILDRCTAAAASSLERSYCLSVRARVLGPDDPAAAEVAVAAALSQAQAAGDARGVAYALRERIRLAWRTGSPDRAWSYTLEDLEKLEGMRDLQAESEVRAGFFSVLSTHYYLSAGYLFRSYLEHGDANALERAFEVDERLRARSLLDALSAASLSAPVTGSDPNLVRRRAAMRHRIAGLERRLRAPGLGRDEHAAGLAALARLAAQSSSLARESAARGEGKEAPQDTAFATVERLRAALRPDEVILSFQVAPWADMTGEFFGGAWLLRVSPGGARLFPLRDPLAERFELRSVVALLDGLAERRDSSEQEVLARLYEALFREAIDGLGPEVHRLIVVPDDVLHRVPFAALRPAPQALPLGLPLGLRYQLEVVPSATLWLRWREQAAAAAGSPALVFADPLVGSGRDLATSPVRAAVFDQARRLGALPGAREEGRAAALYLGGGSRLLIGDEASEAELKSLAGQPFAILHLAAHAIVDEAVPERSQILLAPGGEGEDGRLEAGEIAALPLAGKVVVLSACRSAGGSLVRGEGVMSLARAFFAAGARTVVASLWPLRDDAGAALFERFYRHLGSGLSVAQALRLAQGDRRRAGAQTYDWAGVIVLGDGDLVPLPGGRRHPVRPWVLILLSALAAASAAAVLWRVWRVRRVRRRRSGLAADRPAEAAGAAAPADKTLLRLAASRRRPSPPPA